MRYVVYQRAPCRGIASASGLRHVMSRNTPLPAISDMSISQMRWNSSNSQVWRSPGKFLVAWHPDTSRSAGFSGGETQQHRLAALCGHIGVMYVLDEYRHQPAPAWYWKYAHLRDQLSPTA